MAGREVVPEDMCFLNRPRIDDLDADGSCRYPVPPMSLRNAAIWKLYHLTGSAENYVGADGVPVGRHPSELESYARALGIPWDQTTVERLAMIEAAALKRDRLERDARKK